MIRVTKLTQFARITLFLFPILIPFPVHTVTLHSCIATLPVVVVLDELVVLLEPLQLLLAQLGLVLLNPPLHLLVRVVLVVNVFGVIGFSTASAAERFLLDMEQGVQRLDDRWRHCSIG